MAFYLHRDGQTTAFELDKLRAMARAGELPEDEYVYDDAKGEWFAASAVPELDGAWQLEENEATVAMEIPPDFFDQFDDPAPEPEPEPEPMTPVSAAPAAPAPVAPAPMTPAPVAATPVAPAPVAPAPMTPVQEPVAAPAREMSPAFSAPQQQAQPRQMAAPRGNQAPQEEPIAKLILLSVVTCGIYPLMQMMKNR